VTYPPPPDFAGDPGFLYVLKPYYKGGEYDFLLNSDKQLDLLNKRFIVFELDNIKDNKVLFPIVIMIYLIIPLFSKTRCFSHDFLCVRIKFVHIKSFLLG